MKTAFDKIAAGLADATAYVQGDTSKGRSNAIDVKAVRIETKMTQGDFAKAYHFPVGTVRDWEQGRRQPDTGSATLLKMIQADPDGVKKIIEKVRA